MGYAVGKISEKNTTLWYIIAIVVALIIKIVGYYIAEGILYSNWIAPATSIPGNVVQVVTAGIIVVPIITALKKTVLKQIGGIE